MKNVVFIVHIPEAKKPGRSDPYRFGITSWKKYCEKYGHELYVLTERIYDESYMNANWHKVYAIEILESNEVEFDKVLIVDADTIIHPDAPDIFSLTSEKFYAISNEGSYDWMLRSYENYSKVIFSHYEFPIHEYFNSGFLLVNKANHQEFFKRVIEFYNENANKLRWMQDNFGVGTDQPVLNFLVHMWRSDLELLPYAWNMQELPRREILDVDLTFTEYGYVYHFNGIHPNVRINPTSNKSAVYQWMEHTFYSLYGQQEL